MIGLHPLISGFLFMESTYIQKNLINFFRNFDYKLCNSYVFGWESDFFAISKSKYCIEVEIKISKSDFKADFYKTTKQGINKHDYLKDKNKFHKPNKFYFSFPSGLIDINSIPPHYGIIECYDKGYCKIIRPAKFLHKEKLFKSNVFLKSLMNKFYYRYLYIKEKVNLREHQLRFGQKQLF